MVAFDFSQVPAIHFISSKTFEYFRDFVGAVRMRSNTMRMSAWTVILSVAAIWVFIKLPQEQRIHIAREDRTDATNETSFRVDKIASWSRALATPRSCS